MTDCADVLALVYMYAVSATLWILVFLWWYVQVSCWSRAHVRPLHRLISFALVFKCLLDISQSLLLATCPGTSPTASYLYLAVCSTYTLYFTFLFTTFLLISKGYCVTRYGLVRQEVTVVAMLMGGVYLCYSAYTLDPEGLYPLVFLVMAAVLFTTARFTLRTLKAVRLHVAHLAVANVQELLVPALKKLSIMKNFSRLLLAYFVLELVLGMTLLPASMLSFKVQLANETAQEFCELGIITWMLVLFRPRDLGPYGSLPLVDTGDPGQVRSLPPMLTAHIPHLHLEDMSKLTPSMPLVILQPGDFNQERPYEAIELGQLLPSPNVRDSQGSLSIN